MMRKFIVSIVCMLVIATGFSFGILAEQNDKYVISKPCILATEAVVYVISPDNDVDDISSSYLFDTLDQQQTVDASYAWAVSENGYYAQSFKPTLTQLTRVELKLLKKGNPTGLTISIRSDLVGSDLTSKYLSGDLISANKTWQEFDFPDISTTPGNTYYIVWDPVGVSNNTSNFFWGVGENNPYVNGAAWQYLGSFWEIHTHNESLDPDFCFKTYGLAGGNSPPNTPSNPSPPNQASDVYINTDLSWTCSDPDAGDIVTYDVYFGSMLPLQKVANNISAPSYNLETLANDLTYYWNIVAWDNHGLSTNSPAWHFTTTDVTNNAPNKPTSPSGEASGKVGVSYIYESSTTDIDCDQIYYIFDWGDGTDSGWIGPYDSGDICQESHIWNIKGSYSIKVKAKDINGIESDWSNPLLITMPYSYNKSILQVLELLFERFPQQMGHQFFDTTPILLPMKTFGGTNEYYSWSIRQPSDRKYVMGFETNYGWYSGSTSGPDLWHQTFVDSWSGDNAMGCFNKSTLTYRNSMNFNYLIINETFSTEGAIDMIMDYYCKYITEDSDDYWGIVLYDPGTNHFFDFGKLYGYQPNWTYYIFNIKSAYDYCYQLGAFRNNDGSRSYDFRIGFVFIETDSSGITNSEAEAQGVYWSGIFIDDVNISRLDIYTNDPPNTPQVPSGQSPGIVGVSYEYSTVTTDPEGDNIAYGWDWNEDEIIDEWTGFYPSGTTVSFYHAWTTTGTYNIQVKAKDDKSQLSAFSAYKTVVITHQPNKPEKPTGKTEGKSGNSYTYSTTTTDIDGDQIYYMFDWGDGNNTGWMGPYNSGDICQESYIWNTKGSYSIKVKAKDIHGIESDWSDPLAITMPYSYNRLLPQFFELLFQRFPDVFPLL